MYFGKQCTELLYILIANKTATINENIILFNVLAYAQAIIRNNWKQLERKNKDAILRHLYFITSYTPLCVESTVHLSPYCFSTHTDVYEVIEYECRKIASLFFLSNCFQLFLMMAYA